MKADSSLAIIQSMLTTSAPGFSDEAGAEIAAQYFGIRAKTKPLVSERDQNFRLDAEDGTRYTLKISNQAEQEQVIEFQNHALLHVAVADPSLPLPRVLSSLDGQLHCKVVTAGMTYFVRVFSWLEGRILKEAASDPEFANHLGRLLAKLGLALAGFDHPGSNPPLLWDMKRAAGLHDLLAHVEDDDLRRLCARTLDHFVSDVEPEFKSLRTQVIHNDMNPGNVLVENAFPDRICGLIDFGDMTRSPLIIDLAVAASYQLSRGSDPLEGALPMIAGYNDIRPLLVPEMALLTDLIRTRLVTSILIGSYRAKLFPENKAYLLISQTTARQFLAGLQQLDPNQALKRIAAACARR